MPRYLVMKFFKLLPPKVECFNDRSVVDEFLFFLRGIEVEYKLLVLTGSGYTLVSEWHPEGSENHA